MAARKKKVQREIESAEDIAPVVELMPHQQAALATFDKGIRYQNLIWHRRAGKDWYAMYLGARQARTEVGTYWHLLPKHIQARRAIWNGIDHKTGKRFIELFFPDAVGVNNTEMMIELPSGSTWQLLGSDNYDRMVGSNPRGVVFSEWALCDPAAWEYIRPILRANHGWALFITTFRGRNHAWRMFNSVKDNPEWSANITTIDATKIITPEQVQADRESGMPDRLIRQEYYCEPVSPPSLGPYARAFDQADAIGNVRALPNPQGAAKYVALGKYGDYIAAVECSRIGAVSFIHGGSVSLRHAVHEVLAPWSTQIAEGKIAAVLTRGEFAGVPPGSYRWVKPEGEAATVQLLEQAILAPASVAAAALSNSISVKLLGDEGEDEEAATQAVFAALETLARVVHAGPAWSSPPDYSKHDRAVIGGGIRR